MVSCKGCRPLPMGSNCAGYGRPFYALEDETVKIALASAPVRTRDVEYNLSAMLQAIRQCGGQADLVLFGESVLQGFDCLSWDYETDLRIAVSREDSRMMRIRDAARHSQIAVSFGYIERAGDALFSSQLVIDASGPVIHNFHRVSVGWKEYWHTDGHYQEGANFEAFSYLGKRLAIALCGDLWTEGRPQEMRRLRADAVLWPVWCDYNARRWNESVKYDYARQAALCGDCVVYVNPFCVDSEGMDIASGGAACFRRGEIVREAPAGKSGVLLVEV